MLDKASYLQPIKHAACVAGSYESPDEPLKAFKVDDGDGIALAIGFHTGMLNKVDYFLADEHDIQLIELSDLEKCLRTCCDSIQEAIYKLKTEQETITKREENDIVKCAGKDVKCEFVKKWSGSIAVIERLYRKTNELADADPNYKLLIVCKNHTDVKMLDVLRGQLSGMMGNVVICNTRTLESFLIVKES